MTVASSAARAGVRPYLLWLVLTLSLALNLCFVGGALWIRFHGPPIPINAEERLERIGAQLGLDPQQREAFEQYLQAVRTRVQMMHKAVDPAISLPGNQGTGVCLSPAGSCGPRTVHFLGRHPRPTVGRKR